MVAANDRAASVSRRAEISTVVTTVLALTLALIFAWRFTGYVVDPISALTQKARLIGEGDFDQHITVSSKDEIGVLATEFNRMLVRLRDLRRSDYGRLLIEQKKSDAVIDSIYEPVIVTDARGHIMKINRADRQLFGSALNGDHPDLNLSLSGLAGGERILRAVRSALSMERLRPVDLARASAERFRARAESKEIKIENKVWPDLPWVMGDRRAIARIFDNLLSNAVRHTGRDGLIAIEAREQGDRVHFSVRDTGEGIPEERLPVIFSRFAQIGDKPGGTGLGLALVKRWLKLKGASSASRTARAKARLLRSRFSKAVPPAFVL